MTSKQREKIILADGWYLVSINGSHHNYKHPTKKGRVTIRFTGAIFLSEHSMQYTSKRA